jgi:hypothetical protein
MCGAFAAISLANPFTTYAVFTTVRVLYQEVAPERDRAGEVNPIHSIVKCAGDVPRWRKGPFPTKRTPNNKANEVT